MPKKQSSPKPPRDVIAKTAPRKSWHDLPGDFRGTGSFSGNEFKSKGVSRGA